MKKWQRNDQPDACVQNRKMTINYAKNAIEHKRETQKQDENERKQPILLCKIIIEPEIKFVKNMFETEIQSRKWNALHPNISI